jgi:hypothetical protein
MSEESLDEESLEEQVEAVLDVFSDYVGMPCYFEDKRALEDAVEAAEDSKPLDPRSVARILRMIGIDAFEEA